MLYINAGASVTATGERIPSKKTLRELIKQDPSSVTFDPTSPFNDQRPFDAAHIPDGSTVSVAGPDPYSRRNYFANVQMTSRGIKVT